MDVRVVDRERRRVGEAHDERELVVEELLEPDAVDVERPLECAARDQRDDDERLGVRRGIGDEPDPRVELRAVGEHRHAMLRGPPGDADSVGEWVVGEHLRRLLAARVHRLQLALRLVCLVERDVVVRDELADGVGDPVQQLVEAALRQHLVEDVGELAVRIDRCLRLPEGIGRHTGVSLRGHTAALALTHRRQGQSP